MKNIILLTTKKPSRLYYHNDKSLRFVLDNILFTTSQNIYITSDEEIKEGDSIYCNYSNTVHKDYQMSKSCCKKIILTTDQDLIKEGVQAINDEFLEWFIKNQSCEQVEIKNKQHFEADKSKRINPLNGIYYSYKIIIPKKEPKQELIKNFYCGNEVDYDEQCQYQCKGCVNATGVDYGYLNVKQETIEEVAELFVKNKQFRTEEKDQSRKYSFIQGAEWQQERSYSELESFLLEVKDRLDSFEYGVNQNSYISEYIDEWFKQIKKK